MGLICADIFGRTVLNAPINGVQEVVALSVVACVFLQLANVIREGRLIRADIIMGRIETTLPRAGHLFGFAFHAIGIFIFYKILQWAIPDLIEAWVNDDFYGARGSFMIPLWPFKLALVIGAVGTFLEFIRLTIVHFIKVRSHTGGDGQSTKTEGKTGIMLFGGFLVVVAVYIGLNVYGNLSSFQVGALSIVGMLFLIAIGLPISIALIILSYIGIWMVRGTPMIADNALGLAASGSVSTYQFGVIPLFVLMGLLVDVADVGRDAFGVAAGLLRRVRGGLGIATVAANAIFASITGSSIASAAVFTRVAVPPMTEHGYTRRFSVGSVAGSSVLGMLIPPSLLLIVYGLVAEVSVGKLFIAAIIPGLLLAVSFAVGILVTSRLAPQFVGGNSHADEFETPTIRDFTTRILPIIALIIVVIGGIYAGFFTPTESGAVGAAGALLIAIGRRKLDLKTLKSIILETGHISASILFVMIGASIFSRMLTLSTIPMQVANGISEGGFSMGGFLVVYFFVLILLGMVLDSVSIMLVVLPIMLPVVIALGGDLIWFGIVTVITTEIGLLTPPFGLVVYVVKEALPKGYATLPDIFAGTIPFVLVMVLVSILLMVFPQISRLLV